MIPFISRGNDQLSHQCLCWGPSFPHGLAEHSTMPTAWGWDQSTQSYHSHATRTRGIMPLWLYSSPNTEQRASNQSH